ncbi:hypothetical protein JRQ81_005490 [Phrynocephalus forsythii]|uniref:Dolichyl-diphosphooligosaccharide--protein glycosyltransferase subunit 4 n=1 Tax=Phrynocephalus forsythii TaxID=171643 RepID=A0A9Q0Y3Q9_9SAUR|nr:hypothetical protein JRQ81_005490 [Phrynocephalus forsythii]
MHKERASLVAGSPGRRGREEPRGSGGEEEPTIEETASGTERRQRGPEVRENTMVTDVQLAIFANMLGVSLFLLVVLYHYVAVNNPKKQE